MFLHRDSNRRAHEALPVTAGTYQALASEADRLRAEKEHDIPERFRAARENGDGSSNDEFLAIREEEMVVVARLARLDDILSRARIVAPTESTTTIAIGSTIIVKDIESGKEIDYLIDSAHAASVPGAVSVVSPVGAALLGRRRGELVTVDLPKGRKRNLRVLAIKPEPAR